MKLPAFPIRRLAGIALLCLLVSLLHFDAQAKPNIILIMTDDQGYGDFGSTGNPVIRTPRIDKFAAQSARLTDFYVSPVCSPTRASLMTGRFHYRTRVVDTFRGRSMMDPEETTIAEILSGAGYATGIFGKWHLGDCYPMRPQDQGFQEALVIKGGGLAQNSEPLENDRRYTDPILLHNGEQVQTQGYCTDVYFDAALDWIGQQAEAEKPFFVYLPTNAPHGPFHDPPKALYEEYLKNPDALKGLYIKEPGTKKDRDGMDPVEVMASIAAMITNVDENVGKLLDRLDALSIADNTIVIFMVDNGPANERYVGPFRGKKSQPLDGGVRSPFFFRWPGKVEPGHTSRMLAAHIDVLPTLLAAAEVPLPEGLKIDGRNVLPLLQGEEVKWPGRYIALQCHRGNTPIQYHNFMIRNQRWKLVCPSGFQEAPKSPETLFELYEVANDPAEINDVAADHPGVVAEMKAAYEAWFQDVGTTRPDNYEPPRIFIGSSHENPVVLTGQDLRTTEVSPGCWLVDIRSEGPYAINLMSPDTFDDAEAIVKVDGQEIVDFQDTAQVTGVNLPTGPHYLEIMVTRGKRTAPVYQAAMLLQE